MAILARSVALALTVSLFGGPVSAASEPSAVDKPAAEPTTIKSPARAQFYIRQGLPEPYRGKVNPLKTTVGTVIKGADLYNARCASCHGLMGFGNGAAGGGLRQKPADLAWSLSSADVKDDFLFWTIAEGGAQFGSDMPAYKKDLKEYQVWEIITYMRAAFEGREAHAPALDGIRQAMMTERQAER